jgi:hypothetical protein
MIHLADVAPDPEPYDRVITDPTGHTSIVPFPLFVKGLLVKVPSQGDYLIEAKTLIDNILIGSLCHYKDRPFRVGADEELFPKGVLCDSTAEVIPGKKTGAAAVVREPKKLEVHWIIE